MNLTSQPKTKTRRAFLKAAGVAIGGAALVCAGGGYLATLPPKFEKIEMGCEEGSKMNGKILIAYASKSGTTGEIAGAMGQALCASGQSVDVLPVQAVRSLDGYRAFVVGSGIRMGAWLPEAAEFVQAHAAQLNAAPTAIFTVHLLEPGRERGQPGRASGIRCADLEEPQAEMQGFFAGRMDYSRLSFLEKLISKAMKAPEQDQRTTGARSAAGPKA